MKGGIIENNDAVSGELRKKNFLQVSVEDSNVAGAGESKRRNELALVEGAKDIGASNSRAVHGLKNLRATHCPPIKAVQPMVDATLINEIQSG